MHDDAPARGGRGSPRPRSSRGRGRAQAQRGRAVRPGVIVELQESSMSGAVTLNDSGTVQVQSNFFNGSLNCHLLVTKDVIAPLPAGRKSATMKGNSSRKGSQ